MSKGKLATLTEKLESGESLTGQDAEAAAFALADAVVPEAQKRAFLVALTDKGESPVEISAFAATFRKLATDPGVGDIAQDAIDVCGTGGDKSGSFNFSTTTAFLLAAAGVPVLKHGNRSLTSKCGSADLLERLGIPLTPPMDSHAGTLAKINFTFFFAPAHHPAFKEIMPVRQALGAEGKRTIFNLLGPLINPGQPAYQLLGVFSKAFLEPIAGALHNLGLKRGLVVHTEINEKQGMDELATCGTCHVAGFGELKNIREIWTPRQLGLQSFTLADIQGGDLDHNEYLLHQILDNHAPSPLADNLCLNTGAGLWIAGKAKDIQDGINQARELLSSGKAKTWLAHAQSHYSAQ